MKPTTKQIEYISRLVESSKYQSVLEAAANLLSPTEWQDQQMSLKSADKLIKNLINLNRESKELVMTAVVTNLRTGYIEAAFNLLQPAHLNLYRITEEIQFNFWLDDLAEYDTTDFECNEFWNEDQDYRVDLIRGFYKISDGTDQDEIDQLENVNTLRTFYIENCLSSE